MLAYYMWNGESWHQTSYHARTEQRQFIWNYDFFSNLRPDILRMSTESIMVFLMGMGLVYCLRRSTESQIDLWLDDQTINMLKTSSVWTVQNLELNLVVRTADDGQLYF